MSTAVEIPTPQLSRGLGVFRRLGGGALFWFGVAVLVLLTLTAVFAPLIAPHDPNAVDLSQSLAGSSAAHPLGTDEAGRDTLSRIIYGSRTSLIAPLLVVVGATTFGVLLGVLAAWRGGWTDRVLSRVIEIAWAFPGLMLAMLAVAMFGAGLKAVVPALIFAYIPYMARLTRGVALRERERPYLAALDLQGFSAWWICLRHLLPNLAPFLLAQSALLFGYALIDLAGLSFLGFGVQPPTADWGTMISEAQSALLQGATIGPLSVGIVIVVTVVAFNLVGEGIAARVGKTDR
ncbi:ABC transporter permease [Conexibacter woesei]|uniref:Binding-protein-dependent transport systems inner membrane component n=1 Tax=Conexibacter woesei (strain DSM 14684 / CCUG 47730 / CIP 108061 / JCM 11494 / NBRC 100937 / ID131577) TaxID=469383 RepID=D3F1S9_CONWI|nr:ABC transporter permease [Conexibacter woesei]ADB54110.1 binding-protein-dependent transport systems inner membrane component [Conexibacter woesei DSM 14684]